MCAQRNLVVVLGLLLPVLVSSYSITGSVNVPYKKFEISDVERLNIFGSGRVSAVRDGHVVSTTALSKKGDFTIHSLADAGRYTIFISHPSLRFDAVTVSVSSDGSIEASTYDELRATAVKKIPYPLKLSAAAYQSPYLPEEEFNALQMFKNPMAIIGLVMLGLVYLMPKLQGNMSQEDMSNMRKELEEEGGFAANILKKMIPAEQTGGASSSGGAIPSISNVGKKNQ
jgi:hypothetical protein